MGGQLTKRDCGALAGFLFEPGPSPCGRGKTSRARCSAAVRAGACVRGWHASSGLEVLGEPQVEGTGTRGSRSRL
jgi:hypothetical protein